jgi:predicted transcriptional regulator
MKTLLYFCYMELPEIIKQIKLNKTHGLIKRVSDLTGVSQPSVRKYLSGDIISPKAMAVIKAALEDIHNAG